MTGVCDKASKASKASVRRIGEDRRARQGETGDRLPEGEEDEGLGS